MTNELNNKPKLLDILSIVQRAVYYGVASALIISIGILFASTAAGLLQVLEIGPLETALTVLDRVLLISICVELLTTVQVLVREREIIAEPFLLIALIAVVRRILLATAELEQSIGTETFQSRLVELGVLGALVVILMVAIYFARRTRQSGAAPKVPKFALSAISTPSRRSTSPHLRSARAVNRSTQWLVTSQLLHEGKD